VRGPNFLNYVQYFKTVSNTFFHGGKHFYSGGIAHLRTPHGYGPGVGAHQQVFKYENAIRMAATVISCSTAMLDAKGILQILHLQHRDFHKGFCRKVLRADFDPKYKLGTLLKTDF